MSSLTFEQLGAQYREARAAVGPHRARQAAAEVTHGRLLRRRPVDEAAVADAWAAVQQAAADVAWCLAVTVAAGEAFKGRSLADVLADQAAAPDRRATIADLLSRAETAAAGRPAHGEA